MRRSTLLPALAIAFAATLTLGCDSGSDPLVVEEYDDAGLTGAGPNGGKLVDLGGEYQGELVQDVESGLVTVYLLDADGAPAFTDAVDVNVFMTHGDEDVQLTLSAEPEFANADGKYSKFVTSDPFVSEELAHEHDDALLEVNVDGTTVSGPLNAE